MSKYSAESNSWQEIESASQFDEACAVAMDNCLHVLGGVDSYGYPSAKVARLDTITNTWEPVVGMMRARSNACGTAENGKIFIAGGMGPNKREFNLTSEVYNVTTNEWQLIASLMAPRVGGSMVCLKGALYVLGGVCYGSNCTDDSRFPLTVESYDFENKEWKQKTKITNAEDLPSGKRSKRYVKACALTVCEEFHGKPTTSK